LSDTAHIDARPVDRDRPVVLLDPHFKLLGRNVLRSRVGELSVR
jgi:hypothetical protein